MQRLPLTQPSIGQPIRKRDAENPESCPSFCPNLSEINIFSCTGGFKVTVLTPGTTATTWIHVFLWVLTIGLYVGFLNFGSFENSEDWQSEHKKSWHRQLLLGAAMIGLSPVFILLHAQFVGNVYTDQCQKWASDMATTFVCAWLINGVGLTWKVTNYVNVMALQARMNTQETGSGMDLTQGDYMSATAVAWVHTLVACHALVNGAQWIATNRRED